MEEKERVGKKKRKNGLKYIPHPVALRLHTLRTANCTDANVSFSRRLLQSRFPPPFFQDEISSDAAGRRRKVESKRKKMKKNDLGTGIISDTLVKCAISSLESTLKGLAE